ncbi:hypothetical protein QRD43_09000 [Pelomonas sp. APW6]|uniref:DUF6891 domain-containing protein n=1 Tax=Roseateles subflavus TaxID=3053353 RepID=A0ABT7LGQ9_9BURK|nr:hypothetical protein [Pelomonas sp. APW6]MDL5032045.1 hypothetical protein [Pelomonas sp. APW6]
MPTLDPDILNDIDLLVRGGFEDRDRIVEILTEEMYEPGELDADVVASAVEAAVARHALDQQSWPAVTDCDRLDAVFSSLEGKGLIALQFAGHTQSDGFDDVSEVYQDHPDRAAVIGYCFYHSQDLERAVRGEGLYLAFGSMDASETSTGGAQVGALIAAELRAAGFEVRWNGSVDQRIFVPSIDWKRR